MEWISVKDSVPEDYSLKIVCVVDGEREIVTVANFFLATKKWFTFDDQQVTPTNWMILPEPPINKE